MSHKYALVRIKQGAKVYHDFSTGEWPHCKPPESEYAGEEYQYQTKHPDAVFVAEVIGSADVNAKSFTRPQSGLDCRRDGYGFLPLVGRGTGNYGCGPIIIDGDDCIEVIQSFESRSEMMTAYSERFPYQPGEDS
jgi:hypothetical protein